MRRYHFLKRTGLMRASLALLAGTLLFALHVTAKADVFNYASQRRQVRACVLVSSASMNNGVPRNFAPHLFYVLERRSDVKPGGWEFLNPLSPTTVTGDIRARWAARGADATLNSAAFQAGVPVTKNLGAYWEVNLDKVSAPDLQQFDIVYMGYRGNVFFTPEQRDKLRRYMDAGGTIWLEDLSNFQIGNNSQSGQFVIDLNFSGVLSGLTGISPFANRHPILNYPHSISPLDATLVGAFSAAGRRSHGLVAATLAGRSLVPILVNNGSYLSAADYGAGHLVVSSAGLATGISGYAGGVNVEGPNTGAVSGETMLGAQPIDLKLAYNIISWTSSVPTGAVNARRTGANGEVLGGSLGRKWSAIPLGALNPGSGAVIHKGAMFAVDGNNVLHCYDTNPQQDLDGDRNEDDGIPDLRQGTPYDEIWRLQLPNQLRYSTPTLISIVGPVPDIVAISGSNGQTFAFNAFPRDGVGRLIQPANNTPLWTVALGQGDLTTGLNANGVPTPVPTPAFSEGVLFSLVYFEGATPNAPWRIAATNVITGDNAFGTGAPGVAPSPRRDLGTSVPGMGQVTGSLTVGYVRDDATGAVDKIIYVPTRPINTPGSGAMHGVWFSTRNEPLFVENPNNALPRYKPAGNRARIPWYAPSSVPAGGDAGMMPVLHVVRRDAAEVVTGVETYLISSGNFTVTYEGAANSRNTIVTLSGITLNAKDLLFADYTVNWSAETYPAPSNPQIPQGQEMFQFSNTRTFTLITPPPSDPNNPIAAFVTAHAALSGQDTMVFAATWTGPQAFADRTYGVHEQYNIGATVTNSRTGGAEVAWMYSPHAGGAFLDRQTNNNVQLVPRLLNVDTFGGAIPARQHFAAGLRIIGSPAVYNEVAYVVATANMQGSSSSFPATVIMAFRANPKRVISTDVQFPQDNTQVRVEQIDLTRSNNDPLAGGAVFNELPAGNYSVDRISGTITITNARTNNGDALDFALPLWISVGTQQRQILVDRQTGYGPLDNLIWFMVIPQDLSIPALPSSLREAIQGNSTAATLNPASGPSIIGNNLFFGTRDGRIVSVDLKGGSGGAQVPVITGSGVGKGSLRFHVQDAQLSVTDGTTVTQPIIHPPVGTAGLLAVGAPQGLTAMERQLTLIADNNRLLEVDSGGNAVWSLDATKTVNVAGGTVFDSGQLTASVLNLARPNIARHYTLNDFVVADTGNNRVLLVDKGGFVTFELSRVRNDMKYLRPGDPVSLNGPTDVQTFTESGTSISIFNRDTGVTYSFNGPYTATHYLIADSGNHRLLEVVYAYGANGQPITLNPDPASAMNGYVPVQMLGQVVFVTRTLAEQNARFRYRTIQQFVLPNANNGLDVFLISAIDNQRQGALDPGAVPLGQIGTGQSSSGGSLVILNRKFGPPQPNEPGDGDVARVISSFIFTNNPQDPNDNTSIRRQTISNPTWFKEFEVSRNNVRQVRYLLSDENGCYVLRPGPVGVNELIVEWAFTSDDYYYLTGRRLRAATIQRLPQSDYDAPTNQFYPRYLITNRYTGEDNVPELFGSAITRRGKITGEVFEVRGRDYIRSQSRYRDPGIRLYTVANDGVLEKNTFSAITWMFPNETLPGRDSNNAPILGPIRRSIGTADGATATYLLEQPSFAERPY